MPNKSKILHQFPTTTNIEWKKEKKLYFFVWKIQLFVVGRYKTDLNKYIHGMAINSIINIQQWNVHIAQTTDGLNIYEWMEPENHFCNQKNKQVYVSPLRSLTITFQTRDKLKTKKKCEKNERRKNSVELTSVERTMEKKRERKRCGKKKICL